MRFFILDPEPVGSLDYQGPLISDSEFAGSEKLSVEVDTWNGDDLVRYSQYYLATEGLAMRLIKWLATGVEYRAVEIRASAKFETSNPGKKFPDFMLLKVTGEPGKDHFGLTTDSRLVLSEAALNIVQSRQLSHCDIEKISD